MIERSLEAAIEQAKGWSSNLLQEQLTDTDRYNLTTFYDSLHNALCYREICVADAKVIEKDSHNERVVERARYFIGWMATINN